MTRETPEDCRKERKKGRGQVTTYAVDFCLVDGTLVKQKAVNAVGHPHEDFFMMLEDIEYTTRIRHAGPRIGVLERDLMERANLSGREDSTGKPP